LAAVFTIAIMPALTSSGRAGQTPKIAAKSGAARAKLCGQCAKRCAGFRWVAQVLYGVRVVDFPQLVLTTKAAARRPVTSGPVHYRVSLARTGVRLQPSLELNCRWRRKPWSPHPEKTQVSGENALNNLSRSIASIRGSCGGSALTGQPLKVYLGCFRRHLVWQYTPRRIASERISCETAF
jgi:hypothetical protein